MARSKEGEGVVPITTPLSIAAAYAENLFSAAVPSFTPPAWRGTSGVERKRRGRLKRSGVSDCFARSPASIAEGGLLTIRTRPWIARRRLCEPSHGWKWPAQGVPHSNINMTADVYTHTTAEAEREAALAVERAIYGDLFPVVPKTESGNKNAPVN